jgi:dsDNA-specific endonuclease/ATPase MutS2
LLIIIHGHGTNRVKSAVRRYLGESPYPLSSRTGQTGEGGSGVTVVQLDR